MYYPDQALLVTLALTGLLNLLAVSALVFYFIKLELSFLKFGIAALIAQFIYQLSVADLLLYELHSVVLLSGSAGMMFSIFLFSALCHLARHAVPLWAIGLTLVASAGVGVGVWVSDPGPVYNILLPRVPGLLLVVCGTLALLRSNMTPGHISLAALIAVHGLFYLSLSLIPSAAAWLPLIIVLDSISILLMGSALILICSEWMLADMEVRDEKLAQVEQTNRRLEIQYTQSQKLESLGVLAGGIAHDFNNMLTSMMGYTSLAIKKLPADSEVRKDLYMVMSGGRQAVDLTSQMLSYAGKGALEFETLDLARVIDNMSGVINSIVPRKTHLKHSVRRDLPNVRGDSIQLGQVLMSLLANAVDATETSGGTIEISTGVSDVNHAFLAQSLFADAQEPGVYVYLRVTDSGVGMDSSKISRIFDPFYSEKNQHKGLGLASLSGIVRQHGGFVRVESSPDEGASFSIYLPALAYHEPAQPNRSVSDDAGPASGRERILLADDDSRIRNLITTILENDRYEVVSVVDGREAADEIARDGRSYSAFVIDCTMPRVSGTRLYEDIRTSGLSTPVVLISGYHEEQVIRDIERDPRASFVKKPFNVDQLFETITELVERERTGQKGAGVNQD